MEKKEIDLTEYKLIRDDGDTIVFKKISPENQFEEIIKQLKKKDSNFKQIDVPNYGKLFGNKEDFEKLQFINKLSAIARHYNDGWEWDRDGSYAYFMCYNNMVKKITYGLALNELPVGLPIFKDSDGIEKALELFGGMDAVKDKFDLK